MKYSIAMFALAALALLIAITGIVNYARNAPVRMSAFWQDVDNDIQVVHESSYATRKKVEDTCRAFISNYEAARLMYEQYKDSDKADELSWAAQAKTRANKIATQYNNYILTNSFVWANNIPSDINNELPYIE